MCYFLIITFYLYYIRLIYGGKALEPFNLELCFWMDFLISSGSFRYIKFTDKKHYLNVISDLWNLSQSSHYSNSRAIWFVLCQGHIPFNIKNDLFRKVFETTKELGCDTSKTVETNWKILKEMGTPDHLTCLQRNLDQEATVRTGRGITDRLVQNWKGVHQGCIFSLCLFNLHVEQSISCEMLGWMNHKLESRSLGEISTTSDLQMIPL